MNRKSKLIMIGLAFGFMLTTFLAGFAWQQRNIALLTEATVQIEKEFAEEQAQIALARQLAAQAQLISATDSTNQTIVLLW